MLGGTTLAKGLIFIEIIINHINYLFYRFSMQRLTDIWINLVRRRDQDDAEEPQEEQEDQGDLEESYKNLYWTGLLSL